MRNRVRDQLGPDSGHSENLSQCLMRMIVRRYRRPLSALSEDENQALVMTKDRQ